MKTKRILTVCDEVYHNLLTLKKGDFEEKSYENEHYFGLQKGNPRTENISGLYYKLEKTVHFRQFDSANKEKARKITFEHVQLSKYKMLIYNVLLHKQKEEEKDNVETSIYEIYNKYMGRPLNKTKKMDEKIFTIFLKSLEELTNIYVYCKIHHKKRKKYGQEGREVFHKFLTITEESKQENGDIKFRYSLGEFGEIVEKSRRYAYMMPIELFRTQNITKFLLATYICRLIYVNSRKTRRQRDLALSTLMKRAFFHNKDGRNSGLTYLEKMYSRVSNKTYILRQFMKVLNSVLKILKTKNVIEGYEIIADEKYSAKTFENYKIRIYLNKKEEKA
jgi:hypothetical protein